MKYLLPLLILLLAACKHKVQPDDGGGAAPHAVLNLPELVNEDSLHFANAVSSLQRAGMELYGQDSIRFNAPLDSIIDFAGLWLPSFTDLSSPTAELRIDTGGAELACRVYHMRYSKPISGNAPQLTVAMVNYSNADYACKQFKQRFGPDCNVVVVGGRSGDALAWKQGRDIYLLRAFLASGREQLTAWQKLITDNLQAK